ncbi:MAG: hypothetical protein IT205_10325 [Fimbriimonadaceae bacterium]|nr:hypothetical protein [Fimbriimonadaceae bacterium]
MERTDLLDTSLEVHRQRLRILREHGAQWRLDKALELCVLSNELFSEQTRAWNLRQRKKHGSNPKSNP